MTFHDRFWEDLIMDLADPEFREAFYDNTVVFMQEFHEQKLEEEEAYSSYEEMRRRTHDEWKDATGRKFWVHKRTVNCDVDGCAIHNPSYHPLSDAKQFMREDKSWLIERICDHGIGHPDPDSASFIAKQEGNKSIWVHGCDGCCQEKEEKWPPTYRDYQRDYVGEPYTPGKVKGGWGPHVHRFEYGDDDNGHSGSFCRCGEEEPY